MNSHQTSDYIYFKLGDVLELINNEKFDIPNVMDDFGMSWHISNNVDRSLHHQLCRMHGEIYEHRCIDIPSEYQYLFEL